MSKTYVGIKLQDLGLYNTLDPKNKIVIVKDKDEGVLQLKDFFLYVQSNLDLSNYYTSTQADTIFMAKVDAYTKKDADVKFALVEKTYTRLQSDSRFALAADTFNKTEIVEKYASKEQMYTKDLVYTKEEAITAFALKTEIPILPDLTPYSTTAKGDLRWALKVDVFSKTEADARFANTNNYYTKSQSDTKYALLSNTYTKVETDNKFLDTTEAYTKDYINLNIYTKTQVYTKAETDGKYPLKTDVYTVTAVNDQFAAKSWVYSRAEADNTFRKLADSYNKTEVNALIDASKSGLSTDVSNTYYTKADADIKFELKGTAYNKIDSDAKYALISNSISPSQVAAKYYNKTEVDKAFGDSATNTSNLFALKTAAVGGISLTPNNLTFTKVDGTSSLVAIPTWNQSTTGNAATATKFQTARNIGITGAVTAAGISFDGSSNININATSLDATKLTGIVPDANLNGLYSNVDIQLSNNRTIFTTNSNTGRTVYGLADFQVSGSFTGCVVFKTTIPSNSNTMFQLHISGMLFGEGLFDTIVKTYQFNGSLSTRAERVSRGTIDVNVRFASSPDGYICIIVGDVNKSWYYPHISITHALLSHGVEPSYYKGWTSYAITNLTGYTAVTVPFENNVSVAKVSWANVANRATTRDGYGITDVYTKSDVYTKTESDNSFSFKQESIKSATLNTSTLSFTKADNTVSNISIPTWNQNTTGNAATATTLQTARTINGVAFDGSTSITVADATKLPLTGGTLTGQLVSPNILINRSGSISTGISWYSNAFNAWQDYMGEGGVVGHGVRGNITAPIGQLVTSWAKRSFIENGTGYGWTFESGTSQSTTPTVVAEIRSSDGAARFGGTVQADGGFRFPNRTWNPVGDDAFIGDMDVAGALCIKSANVASMAGIAFFNQAGGKLGTFFSRESDFWFDKRITSDNGFLSGSTITLKTPVVKNSIVELGTGTDAALYTATKAVDGAAPRWLPLLHGSTVSGSGYTNHCSFGMYRNQNTWDNAGFYMAVGGSDASPTEAFYFRLGGRIEYSSGDIKTTSLTIDSWMTAGTVVTNSGYIVSNNPIANYTTAWAPQAVLSGSLLASNDYSAAERAKVPSNGIYSKGNISAGSNVLVSNNVQFNTTGAGIRWDMNTDYARIYFKNDGNVDTNSYLAFDVGDDNNEHFKWFISGAETMALKPQGLTVKAGLGVASDVSVAASKIPAVGIYSQGNVFTDSSLAGYRIGVTNTSGSTGQGISLYGGAVDGVPSYGLMFAGTGTFGTHGDTAADWATYFTMSSGAQRGWIFRMDNNTNVASISGRGHAYFNYVYSYGDVTAFSDRRLKENIEPITNALSKVKELNGVTYTRNDLDDKERVHIGLIAQDVQTVFPAAVHESNDGYLSLNYMGLVGSLVEAIKELDTKNQTLEARLAKLEEKLS